MKCPLVYIQWLDTYQYVHGWEHVSDAKDREAQTVHASGFLINETDDVYVLTQMITKDGECTSCIVIPKGSVVFMAESDVTIEVEDEE